MCSLDISYRLSLSLSALIQCVIVVIMLITTKSGEKVRVGIN